MTTDTCVILCVYNGARFVREALESLLADASAEPEILCLDDGSTDETPDIVKSFRPRVLYERRSHKGIAAARNAAVKMTSREYILFFDSDDLWVKGRLALQKKHFEASPDTDMVFGAMTEFNDKCPSPGEVAALKKGARAAAPGTLMCKRTSFLKVGLFDETLTTAYFMDWYSRAGALGLKTVFSDDVILKRRIHENNSGITERALFSVEHARQLKKHLERVRKGGHK